MGVVERIKFAMVNQGISARKQLPPIDDDSDDEDDEDEDDE